MKRIIAMIMNEYEKALSQNRSKEKFTASQGAGKLLLLFFATMLVFTIVSRAVSSITVAKVTVSNPQRDRLVYSMSGTGEIVPEAEKHLMALSGYRIEDVYVKAGEEVDVGTVLYAYNRKDLQDKYTSIDNEIKKIELLIAGERLRQQSSGNSSQSAKLSLKQAMENLEAANSKLAEAMKEYEDSKITTKEKLLENKNKEYETAIKNYATLLNSQAKQRMQYERVVEDAKTALEQSGEIKSKIKQFIDNYKDAVLSKDKLATYLAEEDIFEAFYGSAEAYEEHKDEIYAKALTVMGEGQNLRNIQINIEYYEEYLFKCREELQKLLNSTDPTVNSEQNKKVLEDKYNSTLNTYLAYLEEYERQVNIMENTYQAESGELRRLRKNDKRLRDYLLEFSTAIVAGVDSEALLKKIYDFVYGDKQKEIEQEVQKKKLALTRAEEDLEVLEREFERARNNLQEEKTELKKVVKSIEDGTYDYEEALEGRKQEVEAAQEAVRIAEQTVERNNLGEAAPGDQNNKEISELVVQSHMIDLEVKKQELEEVRKLMDASGEVRASDKGIVTFVGVEAGRRTTGDEMIRLGFGNYEFRAEFDREDAASLAEGVTAIISLEGKRTKIEVEIENITISDNGRSEMTARMPEDEYGLGEKAGFRIETQSEQFDLCIPIQALREDNYGNYVLITREQEDILGTQLIAERIDIMILDKGRRTVAVDGAISSKSQVITDSNKIIYAGDRIRINY